MKRMHETLVFHVGRLKTPTGEMVIVFDDSKSLRAVEWCDHESRMRRLLRLQYGGSIELHKAGLPREISAPLREYFEGQTRAIEALTVKTGGTDFQKRVWRALRKIPSGKTVSYAELAKRIGAPKAMRAVGHANGANPICIVVPCHRVIASNGVLSGYGGGIERKRWLLEHEIRAVEGRNKARVLRRIKQAAKHPIDSHGGRVINL